MSALLLALGIPAALLSAGVLYQRAGVRRDARRLPLRGRWMQSGVRRLHVNPMGDEGPPVLFEAGIAASSLSWCYVQPETARFARTASYDRAGLGLSEVCRPLTSDALLDDMRQVLRTMGPPPYVLVGHSFGGLLVRLYAARHRSETAGLVLVDPALLSEWLQPDERRSRMLASGVRLSRRGAVLARFGFVRVCLDMLAAGSRVVPKAAGRLSSGGGSKVIERLSGEVGKMPRELWPAVMANWSDPRCFQGMAAHLELLPAVAQAVAESPSLGDIPLVVISGGHLSEAERAEQDSVTRLSTRGRHVVASGSGHWAHLDEPRLVVQAIRDVIGQRVLRPEQ